jgi:hypothetical protein
MDALLPETAETLYAAPCTSSSFLPQVKQSASPILRPLLFRITADECSGNRPENWREDEELGTEERTACARWNGEISFCLFCVQQQQGSEAAVALRGVSTTPAEIPPPATPRTSAGQLSYRGDLTHRDMMERRGLVSASSATAAAAATATSTPVSRRCVAAAL